MEFTAVLDAELELLRMEANCPNCHLGYIYDPLVNALALIHTCYKFKPEGDRGTVKLHVLEDQNIPHEQIAAELDKHHRIWASPKG